MRRPVVLVVLSLLAVALVAGCGGGTKQPATLAPSTALFYGEVELKPDGDQKSAIDALARKFPGSGDAGRRLSKLVDQGLREGNSKVSFDGDIKPWLGDTAAFFATDPGGGA